MSLLYSKNSVLIAFVAYFLLSPYDPSLTERQEFRGSHGLLAAGAFEMFAKVAPSSTVTSALTIAELVYHSIVRTIRKSHRNAMMSILSNVLQTTLFVAVFYFMFVLLGMRGAAIRGDFLIYVMSGIFLFMAQNKTITAVSASEGPTSPMMLHAPMNTIISIAAAALSTLYIQVLTAIVLLFLYHVAVTPVEIDNVAGTFGMLVMAWFSGATIGIFFLPLKPWAPTLVNLLLSFYQRANMIASGKMFVANALPTFMLNMFDWNPLFHCIDQARGFAFINYVPRNSSMLYPLYVSLALLVIGMMIEFFTRKNLSASWSAKN